MLRKLRKIHYAAPLSFYDLRRLVRQRLPRRLRGPAWTASELLASSKHGRGIRFAELMLRQEACLTRAVGYAPIDFDGAAVIEIGCGPLGGYGPLAIFQGARSFQSADPEWDPALFADAAVAERYLRVMHADLTALFGPRMSFDAFRDALAERMTIHRGLFDDAPIDGSATVFLSQSVLEHVGDIDAVFARMRALSAPGARHLHLVDFGNHYPTSNPFKGLYSGTAEAYQAARPGAINLLRVNEVAERAAVAELAVQTTPIRSLPLPEPVHASWRARADEAALGCHLALLSSG